LYTKNVVYNEVLYEGVFLTMWNLLPQATSAICIQIPKKC